MTQREIQTIRKASELWAELDKLVGSGFVVGTTDDFHSYDTTCKVHGEDCTECNDLTTGLWCCGECDFEFQGWPVASYWAENHEHYDLGVLIAFEKWLTNRGWYSEWYDAGTLMLYRI